MYDNNNRMTVEGEERGFSGRKWGTDKPSLLGFSGSQRKGGWTLGSDLRTELGVGGDSRVGVGQWAGGQKTGLRRPRLGPEDSSEVSDKKGSRTLPSATTSLSSSLRRPSGMEE